ncbi:endonuclease/exonuclease/phosphatase family domain-containing protein 1-like [Galleria mellonella]|uniref:Endonuclease/exonuclease/phosphatase family domain-containing protein 1-like n=1 Tax=Galleria mellonella TaxID=7137 RepID=A0A6J1WP77_GALME|nr:endonuclease/exonuclease/phosphatase family domain-containing protein 1-like [Galleria mellonella]
MGQSSSSVTTGRRIPNTSNRRMERHNSIRSLLRRSTKKRSKLSHTFNLPSSNGSGCSTEYQEQMNVNTATEEQLMTLPDVSRQLAQEIVRHRKVIGGFKKVDDLALVSGLGAEKLELLRPEICVKKQLSRASSCTQSLDSVRITGESKLCSVNSSSVFQLQCVPGLNQEIAANIVDYRNKKGPFKSLDDLIKVRGMDNIKLLIAKQHLSLELRKYESMQTLMYRSANVNGWTEQTSVSDMTPNGGTSTPKSRLTTTRLPNGFATAPVNDILELLSACSHRPLPGEMFNYERCGVRCCRLASWNLHQLSLDKIFNPGVREVVCLTILENKLSLVAIQDVIDKGALKEICDELNSPVLRRVREFQCNSRNWEYCIPEQMESENLGFIYDAGDRGIKIEHITGDHPWNSRPEASPARRLVVELSALSSKRFTSTSEVFLICERPVVLMNMLCTERLNDEECIALQRVAELALNSGVQLALVGEFCSWDNVQSLPTYESLLNEDVKTSVNSKNTSQSSILCPGPIDKSSFNGYSGAIKSGLCHLAIPRDWSWGGPASPFCPIWAELNVPD